MKFHIKKEIIDTLIIPIVIVIILSIIGNTYISIHKNYISNNRTEVAETKEESK